jgi:SAM-dependent methyltransferase
MDVFLRRKYKPHHIENRMKNEGDTLQARAYFLKGENKNLQYLLYHRYHWMNAYINEAEKGLEVGAGCGFSKYFLPKADYIMTDYDDKPWLDKCNVDALQIPYPDESFDYIISSNMIHHLPYPIRFFKEMSRVLKKDGRLIVQEIYGSYFLRLILRIMKHEGYDFSAQVWDKDEICTDPNDLWSANCVLPNLLFDDTQKFEQHIKEFSVERKTFSEFFMFLNSGGVVAKTKFIPLPKPLLSFVGLIDKILVRVAPKLFAMQMQVVLVKK